MGKVEISTEDALQWAESTLKVQEVRQALCDHQGDAHYDDQGLVCSNCGKKISIVGTFATLWMQSTLKFYKTERWLIKAKYNDIHRQRASRGRPR